MTEKEAIERSTAEGFLALYNALNGTTFAIVQLSDAPDVRCRNTDGNLLSLEITTTEDRPGDIKALLGRSDHLSLEALQAHNARVARGEERPRFSSFAQVTDYLVRRIQDKINKDYGPSVALVIRDSSGVDWDWDEAIPCIHNELRSSRNPFSRGIWVLSRAKDRLFRIV